MQYQRMICYAGSTPLKCKWQQMRNKRGALVRVAYCPRCGKYVGRDRNHRLEYLTEKGPQEVEQRRKYYKSGG